jgi:hypothetical protein
MSIQPAKISEEAHSSNADLEPPGYVERVVQWFGRQILHLKIPSWEQLSHERMIDEIHNMTLCPTVLFRQFERHVVASQRLEIYEELGKNKHFSYKERAWNWIFSNPRQTRRRHRETGKMMAMKNPYLLAQNLIKALSAQNVNPGCQCHQFAMNRH